ncbi:hypothetical protein ACFYM0_14965 [Streptomyces sp. NPDC006487]|uniref:hypothetical protein n=1 Tax=Streptomyces sp. NPDC006487 TaxID=3364748 RepID=UPI003677E2CE
MTSLAAWVGVDQRGPASVYVATDSRVSWANSSHHWDGVRKTFSSTNSPDVFGYVGDVLFPALVLPTVAEILSHESTAPRGILSSQSLFRAIVEHAWSALPIPERRDVQLVHATREGEGVSCEFGFQVLKYSAADEAWASEHPPMPDCSSGLVLLGSGKGSLNEAAAEWKRSDAGGTSRAEFGAFCEALGGGADPRSGGAPQIVGLYRKGPGRLFGTSWAGSAHVSGLPLPEGLSIADVEWRNHLFERTDSNGQRVAGAQIQPDRKRA